MDCAVPILGGRTDRLLWFWGGCVRGQCQASRRHTVGTWKRLKLICAEQQHQVLDQRRFGDGETFLVWGIYSDRAGVGENPAPCGASLPLLPFALTLDSRSRVHV